MDGHGFALGDALLLLASPRGAAPPYTLPGSPALLTQQPQPQQEVATSRHNRRESRHSRQLSYDGCEPWLTDLLAQAVPEGGDGGSSSITAAALQPAAGAAGMAGAAGPAGRAAAAERVAFGSDSLVEVAGAELTAADGGQSKVCVARKCFLYPAHGSAR
jgi:hypothetical protein